MNKQPQCTTAIDDLEKRLESLQCSDGKIVKLVQFNHNSPGLMALRRRIAEAVILVIEENHAIESK